VRIIQSGWADEASPKDSPRSGASRKEFSSIVKTQRALRQEPIKYISDNSKNTKFTLFIFGGYSNKIAMEGCIIIKHSQEEQEGESHAEDRKKE
jgi:hypothetical protein